MPVWHDATRRLQEEGRITLVGIIQEQHPDRARLFMQWKEMSWPLLWDPINLTETKAVPRVWAVDEQGIVRAVGPDPATIAETFVDRSFEAPAAAAPPAERLSLEALARNADSAEGARNYGDALLLYKGSLEAAIAAYRRAVELDAADGRNHFRLGVALRARFDSELRQPGDLQAAVNAWSLALEQDPNQYIWRRRIQQYGPRLEKPYPFYDWVAEARADIGARSEEPLPLRVEPRGSEIADPAKVLPTPAGAGPPDPEGRLHRDPGPGGSFVDLESAVVPPAVKPGEPLRLHLMFRPNDRSHWNNEADALRVYLEPPAGWQAESRMEEVPLPQGAVSDEPRAVEFDLVASPREEPRRVAIPIQAFYYVCETTDGTCLYRRKDASVELEVRKR